MQGHVGVQDQFQGGTGKGGLLVLQCELVTFTGIVKGRDTLEAKINGAAHATGDSDDGLHAVLALIPRHEINYFADTVRAEKARHQDIRVGQVHLLETAFHRGPNAKETAFLVIQDFGENAGGVEARQATPVDGTFAADERSGTAVTDHSIVINIFKRHLRGNSYFSQ